MFTQGTSIIPATAPPGGGGAVGSPGGPPPALGRSFPFSVACGFGAGAGAGWRQPICILNWPSVGDRSVAAPSVVFAECWETSRFHLRIRTVLRLLCLGAETNLESIAEERAKMDPSPLQDSGNGKIPTRIKFSENSALQLEFEE